MFRALSTAALGMSAQQRSVDNIANNLANVGTTGFKRSTIAFQDLFYENIASSKPGNSLNQNSNGPSLQIGHGSRAVATIRNFTQGSVAETGNALDLAVSGAGFFQVELPDGNIGYTRDGNFSRDATGILVNNSGLPLASQLEIPTDAVAIEVSQNGTVTALMAGDNTQVELGQIELAKFSNPGGLEALGDNLFAETESSGMPFFGEPGSEGFGVVRQGYLEQSNVDIVTEMVRLIEAQRAYETNSKMVQTAEDMMSVTNSIKR
jgi:flagellar basal-body rod protein FlgG